MYTPAGKWLQTGGESPPVLQQVSFSVAIGTTPTRFLESDPMRIAVLLSQNSGNNILWWLDDTVTLSKGMWIANGAQMVTIIDGDTPGLAGQELWAVSNVAASHLNGIYIRVIE